MSVVWGLVVFLLSMLAWGGQTVAWLAPDTAVRWSLMEAQDDVETTYWADIRAEAPWDFLTLWTLVVAGVLLIADNKAWAYFGLVGGGTYVYFAGRGILTRAAMQRSGLRIGSQQNLRLGYTMLAVWGLMGLITIIAAIATLAD